MEYKEIQGISQFIDQKDFVLIAPIKEDFGIEKYEENYDTLLEECTEKNHVFLHERWRYIHF